MHRAYIARLSVAERRCEPASWVSLDVWLRAVPRDQRMLARRTLEAIMWRKCQHVRSVSVDRVESVRGNVGLATLSEIREVLGLLTELR